MKIKTPKKVSKRKPRVVRLKTSSHSLPVAGEVEMSRLIEVSAFLLAEKDDFEQSPDKYWLAAEKEINLNY